jgi:spermidine/putrescine transport system permease protein
MVRRENILGQYALLAPMTLATVMAVAVTLGMTAVLSFQAADPSRLITGFSLTAYREAVFGNPLFGRILLRTVLLSAAITCITVLAAIPVAYYLAFRATRHKHTLLLLITAPFFTSYLLRVFAWKIILGFNGVINASLIAFGIIDQPLTFLVYNPMAIVLALSHAYVAFAVLPIYVAFERIDRDVMEVAADLGARPFTVFCRVALPLAMPGIAAAAILTFMPTIGDYVTPTLVGGPDGLMIGNVIQTQFGKANDWPAGSAISMATIVLVSLFVCLLWLTFHLFKGAEE